VSIAKGIAVAIVLASAATLIALSVASGRAADSPYHTHCDAPTDVAGYYIGEMATVLTYTGHDAAKIVSSLFASGYYANVDTQMIGATTLWIGIDEADGISTIFFYGDNGCAFGYDDTWDRDSIAALLSSVGLPIASAQDSVR
jgi:hypothetical protein